MAISESRKAMIEEDANGLPGGGGGSIWNYVDKQRAEELGLHQYRPAKAPSDNFIRIVAPNSEDPFRLIIWRHQNVGANGNTYLCLNKMYEERCPICELLAKLKLEDPKHPALDTMYAGRRVLMYVVDTRDDETEAEGTKWFDCPPSVYTGLVGAAKVKRTGAVIDIACPDEGCTVSFERQQKKGNPYCNYDREESTSIPDEWFANLPAYEDILLLPEAADIELQISGIGVGTRDAKDEKTSSRRRQAPAKDEASTRRSRRSRPAAAEEKAEEAPVSSRRSRPAAADESKEELDPPFTPDAPPEEKAEEKVEAAQEAAPEEQAEGTPKVRSRLDKIRERRKNQ